MATYKSLEGKLHTPRRNVYDVPTSQSKIRAGPYNLQKSDFRWTLRVPSKLLRYSLTRGVQIGLTSLNCPRTRDERRHAHVIGSLASGGVAGLTLVSRNRPIWPTQALSPFAYAGSKPFCLPPF